jgi:hypothetical protein
MKLNIGGMKLQEADDELEEKAEDLKLNHQIRFDSTNVPVFGELVHSQLKKRFNKEIKSGHTCDKCYKSFNLKWRLTHHIPYCLRPERQYAHLKVNGNYSCLICALQLLDKDDVKKHLFYNHSEVDILAKYGQPFQRVVGNKMHTRLRAPMLLRIGKGNFDRALQIVVEKIDKFDPSTLDHIFPLAFDEDPLNK